MLYHETMTHHGLLGLREVLGSGMYGLRSFRGEVLDQALHIDYAPDVVMPFAHEPDTVPLSALWGPMAPFPITIAGVTYVVPAGHLLVFRGDLEHAGGPYMSAYLRFHAFVALQGTTVPTYIYH